MSQLATRPRYGLERGTPEMRSAGPIAFGPDGILFVADSDSAAIFALEVGDGPARGPIRVDIDDIETRLGAYLGCGPEDVFIRDMAVHPSTQEVYFSLTRGSGQQATPVLLKASGDGAIEALSLDDIPYSKTTIQDAPAEDDARVEVRVGVASDPRDGEMMEPRPGFKLRVARDPLRQVTVTDLAYVDGVLLVAGASNEEFSSTLRRIPFPFGDPADSASLEIFHVSHGKYETASPIRAFVPFGGTNVLASYTCTPVVQFSLAGIAASTQLKGKTVAELGAGNTPLDMVAYRRDGEEFLLVSNSRHPLMKIATKDIPGQAGLTEPREPMGVPRESLEHAGVSRMANLDGEHVLMLQRGEDGKLNLRSHDCRDL